MHNVTSQFFGLAAPVFGRPPKVPYLDPCREKAIKHLNSLVERRGFALVTGPPGCGKTALVHYLCSTLNESHHKVCYVPFAFLEKGHLLRIIAERMHLNAPRGIATTLNAIHQHLHDLQPANPLLVLDEIDRLEARTTHIVRLVAHHRADTAYHTTLILIGHDSFIDDRLCLQDLEPLRQRITLYCRLQPFGPAHTQAYIEHCLCEAGRAGAVFDEPALQLIHERTGGLARVINTLAGTAMDIAAEQRSQLVGLDHVQEAADTALPPQPTPFLS
jgi:type II secretory pathway predicted ATPase ExeA